ncbi:MAG: hypothetical protein M3N28_01755 [Actinomycetota bacterium]|nr:hypothetical protein [Actinomycetota bacterium]
MSNVDNEQTKPGTPLEGPDDKVAAPDPVNTGEGGNDQVLTAPVEEAAPVIDGDDGPVQGAEQSDNSVATGKSDAVAEEGDDEIEEPTATGDVPVEGDGVKQVSRGDGGPRGQAFRRYWPFVVLGLTTVILIVGLFVAISGDKDPSPSPGDNPRPAALGPMETFTDPEGGFSLRYPKAWRRIPVPPEASAGSDLRLVLSTGSPNNDPAGNQNPTGEDGMWVRVIAPDRIDQKITDFAEEIKGLTGDKPCGAEGSACLRQEQVSVAGMNGVRYVYTSLDDVSKQNSVHIQYFLRRAQGKLYVLVFQAVPPADLDALAPAFDEVLASFQAP